MKARLIAAASAVAVAAGVTGGIVLSSPASAVNTTICGQYESKKVQGGEYIVQNNVWGTSAPSASTLPRTASPSPSRTG